MWRPDLSPDFEPSSIAIKRGAFIDAARADRQIPYKIYYPSAGAFERLPLIIWSHGLGGGADGAAFLARYIASHGYIVANIQHHGTDTGLWEGKPGHPWDVIRATPIPRSAVFDRFADVSFVYDSLVAWIAEQSEIAGRADLSCAGISGHSFGALTSQVIAGQGFPDEDDHLVQRQDSRFCAGILYSPVPVFHLTGEDPAVVYGSINIPLLHMTGTQDASPVEGFAYEKRLAVYEHAGQGDQYLAVLQDGDHMVFAGSRGKLAENPKRGMHEGIIKILSLAFWEAYLREDDAACRWLAQDAEKWLNGEAAFSHRIL